MDIASHKSSVLSILYVDDDLSTLHLFATILTKKYPNVQIYSADNGEAGLELFKQHGQNVFITNLNCTSKDCIKLATEIKRLNAVTQIIVISGYSEKEYQTSLCEIDIIHYIHKPIKLHQIFTAIEDSFKLQKLLSTPQISSSI